jgi:hypothetical protein
MYKLVSYFIIFKKYTVLTDISNCKPPFLVGICKMEWGRAVGRRRGGANIAYFTKRICYFDMQ